MASSYPSLADGLVAATSEFRSAFLGVMFALLDASQQTLGPTMTVIISALVCEYQDSSPVPPARLLQGLASQLSLYNGSSYR